MKCQDPIRKLQQREKEAREKGLEEVQVSAASKGPATEIADVEDQDYQDGVVARQAIESLRRNKEKPFFMCVGFAKPHLPFAAPRRYWNLYQREQFAVPERRLPEAAPTLAFTIEKEFVGNPEGHRKWLWDHMADVLPQTADFVTEWDTINHIVGWGEHTYEKEYGGLDIYTEILAEARRLAPDATHAINEGKVLPDGYKREPYKRVIRFLNEQGQAPDIVGFMAHFGVTTLTPPEELLEVYDDFAAIAPRLQLSEFDVESGDDYELQADYYRDCMIATFSHPNFEAIIQWGFWGNMHWKPGAALWRDDWTLNPSGEAFLNLVAKEWRTDEKLKTDSQGRCQVRGFLGDYHILVDKDGKSKKVSTKLDRNGVMVRVQTP